MTPDAHQVPSNSTVIVWPEEYGPFTEIVQFAGRVNVTGRLSDVYNGKVVGKGA